MAHVHKRSPSHSWQSSKGRLSWLGKAILLCNNASGQELCCSRPSIRGIAMMLRRATTEPYVRPRTVESYSKAAASIVETAQ